uniref:XK-related protein n=1 Tax=Eptatretus burgeri TaxID=7764 RepID=A0A8C4QPZ9_EPTBU
MATAVSLLALSWALAAYNKALRDARDDKATMGLARAALQLTWRACTIFSRVVSFALFASIFQVYFGIFVVAHWYLVTFWVIYGGTDFCTSKWEEILFNLAVGVVYIFCWLSVHEGQTCGRMLAYYGLVAAENLTLTLAWFMYRHTASTASFAIPAVLAVVGSFAAGMSCALVYYGLAHPSGRRFSGLPSSCCSEVLDGVPLPPAAQAQQQITPVVASGDEGLGQPGLGDSDVYPHTWRPSEPLAPVPTTPLPDAAVIRVDMPRKRYPAWEAHHIDRRLRSAIVGLQTSALRAVPSLTTAATAAPVVRYRDGAIYELIDTPHSSFLSTLFQSFLMLLYCINPFHPLISCNCSQKSYFTLKRSLYFHKICCCKTTLWKTTPTLHHQTF